MDVVTDIISGNPLSTPIGAKVERATAVGVTEEDWAEIMLVCDEVNALQHQNDGQSARDAWRAIRRRLHQTAGKDHTAFNHTLTVLEACMKNCGRRFHVLACQKDFVQDLVKMIGPKYDPPVLIQERVLGMIRCWAEAFSRQPDMVGVRTVYEEMTARSVAFPAPSSADQRLQQIFSDKPAQQRISGTNNLANTEPNHPPTHQRTTVQASDSTPRSPAQNPTTPSSSVGVDGERLSRELCVVDENVLVLSEMLTALKPTEASSDDLQLLQRLVSTCREMHSRLVQAIDNVSDDSLVAEMLRINDELNNCFIRYERFERVAGRGEQQQQKQESELKSPVSLLDTANDSALSRQAEQLTLQPTPIAAAAGSVAPPIVEKPPTSSQQAAAPALPLSDDARPSDFDEMEKWLKDDIGSNASGTMTSSEFDNFLAERARASRPDQKQ